MSLEPGPIGLTELGAAVGAGTIDTVVCALPDIWGRLVGKRVTGRTFLQIATGAEGLHGSLYLFVVDMEMEPRPGFDVSNWSTGFSDFHLVPDLSTIRVVPWLERTAIVLCDARDADGELVEVAPRTILRRQVDRAAAADLRLKVASELEFFLFQDTLEEAWESRYRVLRPLSRYRADYHVLQSERDEWIIGAIRRHMDGIGIEVECSKSEWGLGQQEVNLRYADVLEMADRHVLYKAGVKEIAAASGLSVTFMAKWAIAEVGSSFHLHSSLWPPDGSRSLMGAADDPEQLAPVARHYLGGQLGAARELAWLYAPNINSYKRFKADSFAPTAIVHGHDNRTCAFRVVGEGPSLRIENRIPGADANPYLSYAATIAAGLHGVREKLDPGPAYDGNAYEAQGIDRVPATLAESVNLLSRSTLAREAFGEAVVDHLVNIGHEEVVAFQSETVTDWELMRYFERT